MWRKQRRISAALLSLVALAGCATTGGVSLADRDAIEESGAPDESSPGTAPPTSPPTTEATPDEPAARTLDWDECDDPLVTEDEVECATLTVPLDYDDPSGDTIDLALVRVPAGGDRKGAVLFNPGGPGGSGFDPIAASGS
ncbi:MAG TPA: hypothetical protein VGK49_11785, partial [Ilumatobacteraceae bacterium]